MSVSKEGKVERVQIAQSIFSQAAVTTVNFLHYDFQVKFIIYLVKIANRNHCRFYGDYKLKLNTW